MIWMRRIPFLIWFKNDDIKFGIHPKLFSIFWDVSENILSSSQTYPTEV